MWIDIDDREEPISGVLRGDGRADVPFHGWLQLAAALERAWQDSQEATTEVPAER